MSGGGGHVVNHKQIFEVCKTVCLLSVEPPEVLLRCTLSVTFLARQKSGRVELFVIHSKINQQNNPSSMSPSMSFCLISTGRYRAKKKGSRGTKKAW